MCVSLPLVSKFLFCVIALTGSFTSSRQAKTLLDQIAFLSPITYNTHAPLSFLLLSNHVLIKRERRKKKKNLAMLGRINSSRHSGTAKHDKSTGGTGTSARQTKRQSKSSN